MNLLSYTVTTILHVILVNGNGTEVPSDRFLRFLTLFSAKQSDLRQSQDDVMNRQSLHAPRMVNIWPVELPNLNLGTLFIFEHHNLGEVQFIHLVAPFEGDDGVIYVKQFTLPVPDNYRPGCYNMSVLKSLREDDLKYREECTGSYREVGPNVFFSLLPVCDLLENGEVELYTGALTCDGIHSEPPNEAVEGKLNTPSRVEVIERYPLLPYMYEGVEEFENPCQE